MAPKKRPARLAALRGAEKHRERKAAQKVVEEQEKLERAEERARWKFDPEQWEARPSDGVIQLTCHTQEPLGIVTRRIAGNVYIEDVRRSSWAASNGLATPCQLLLLNDAPAQSLGEEEFIAAMSSRPLTLSIGSLQFKCARKRERSRSRSRNCDSEARIRGEDFLETFSTDLGADDNDAEAPAATSDSMLLNGASGDSSLQYQQGELDAASQFTEGVQNFWQLADWVSQKQESRARFLEKRDEHIMGLETVVGSIEEMFSELHPEFTSSSGMEERRTPVPSELLYGELREYQKDGLHWLATLYDKDMSGILADEMGLGKTIMTIALICHLAVHRANWGPHLIVVPASVQFNWVSEFHRWAPGLKVLNIHGSRSQRASLRHGWTKGIEKFNVCITSFSTVIVDGAAFERIDWKYLIVDEAHRIKNRASSAWQQLFRFSNVQRLLLTGTPLQNDLMEVFHLLYFLMPSLFVGFAHDFKALIVEPLQHAIRVNHLSQTKRLILRIHDMLRPFMLRRLKRNVEIWLPPKREFVVMCDLSGRQKTLYEEFMNRRDTQHRLQEGAYFRIMSVAMQLRKVCNHPELFEPRRVRTAFTMQAIQLLVPIVLFGLQHGCLHRSNLSNDSLIWPLLSICYRELKCLKSSSALRQEPIHGTPAVLKFSRRIGDVAVPPCFGADGLYLIGSICSREAGIASSLCFSRAPRRMRLGHSLWLLGSVHQLCELPRERLTESLLAHRRHSVICRAKVNVLPQSARSLVRLIPRKGARPSSDLTPQVAAQLSSALVVQLVPAMLGGRGDTKWRCPLTQWFLWESEWLRVHAAVSSLCPQNSDPAVRLISARMSAILPEKHLLTTDCGKLQKLGRMLHQFQDSSQKCVIFSQFSSMLDILEGFLNFHSFTYRRLDGMTQVSERQPLVDRFNQDPSIFVFLASTRAGGVGLNLTGASVVIFYDSDWNPSVDKQAMDRVHRIGQEKEVFVYRMVTRHTLEETMWHKQLEKGYLTDAILDDGHFDAEALRSLAVGENTGVSAKDLKDILGLRCRTSEDDDSVSANNNGALPKPRAKHRARPHAEGNEKLPGLELSAVPPLVLWGAQRIQEGKQLWPHSFAPLPKCKARKVEKYASMVATADG